MIVLPIINYVFNYNKFKKLIPYSNYFNTFTMNHSKQSLAVRNNEIRLRSKDNIQEKAICKWKDEPSTARFLQILGAGLDNNLFGTNIRWGK